MGKRIYRLGLDIGIGSVGWAVISTDEQGRNGRIESFGTRIFESGEKNNGKDRTSQERRGFRHIRRTLRRRRSRKDILKNYLKYIRFLKDGEIRAASETPETRMVALKCRAAEEPVSREDLLRILIHFCNHRGYRDFYEPEERAQTSEDTELEEDGATKEEQAKLDEERGMLEAADSFDRKFQESGCRTVSQYIRENYVMSDSGQYNFRNHDYKGKDRLVVRRKHFQDEAQLILERQAVHCPELTEERILHILDIIFRQRDFEDGPGDSQDENRRYKGFLDTLGMCRFYPEEKRGFRNTVLGDLYAAVNAFSQYRYVNEETGEAGLTKEAAQRLIEAIMKEGSLTRKQAEKLLKPLRLTLLGAKDVDTTLTKSFRYIRLIKKAAEKAGLSWEAMIENKDCWTEREPLSFLNQLGDTLSSYQTPRRRVEELRRMKTLAETLGIPVNDTFWTLLKGLRLSGTSGVSYHHMADAVEAFLDGDIYGNFQWGREKRALEQEEIKKTLLLPPDVLSRDEDLKDNPVVLRSINETRKILNALIRVYGTPDYINVEVADDVARSYVERQRLDRLKKANEKENEAIRRKVAEILQCDPAEVKGPQIERYKLYCQQEGKCLYSGEPLDLKRALILNNHEYEVDHIVPYSLILDNTIHNKALVLGSENQSKRQQTPLMYLKGEKREAFLARVEAAYRRKSHPISQRKYQYLHLESIYGDKAAEVLKGWKSRNINDTRYITKYVVGLLKHHLAGSPKVYGIRGHITSRFRKEWLNRDTWGSEEKNRGNYLNHAADAVIIANLTEAAAVLAMDYEKLRQVQRHFGGTESMAYQRMLVGCVKQLSGYYHMDAELARARLQNTAAVPSVVPGLRQEVDLRFGPAEGDTRTAEEFQHEVELYYGGCGDFILPPYQPITSIKPERRFRGAVADSNPIRLMEIDGDMWKISRRAIGSVKKKDLPNLYTTDGALLDALHTALDGQADSYTVQQYLDAHGMDAFLTTAGQVVRKVSVKEQTVSNYYKKYIRGNNYSILGMPKTYCAELYKDSKGKTRIWGIRYVDMKKENGKLYLLRPLPADYVQHMTYLYKNDYIEVSRKNTLSFSGFYQAVKNINNNRTYVKEVNKSNSIDISLGPGTTVQKYAVSLLGQKGGCIDETKEGFPCFAPLSSKKGNG